jgi:YidC/Oxa1 family membrane protein insertase
MIDLKIVDAASTSVSELKKDKPAIDLTATDPHPLLWAGACSSYFQSIYRPDYAALTTRPAVKIASVLAGALDGGPSAAASGDVPTSLVINTTDFTIQAGQEVAFDGHVFFGPKLRQLLENPYYSKFPLSYDKNLVYTGGWCGFLTFNWLINVLYGILWFFHSIFRDWGLAIIGLVCLVRLLLHPITKRSQISMMEMGKKGPEIERLKKKFADNKEELNKAMMEVMNPAQSLLGCLPMFLQTPIWIALWNALQSTFELRQAGFLRWQHLHLTWIADLSKQDALIQFSDPIPLLFGWHLSSINVLPLLVGVASFVQQVYMVPTPTNMTPEQEQQRKMQRWMLLLFPVMLYAGPSGLNLYILTSSTIGMIESKIIRDHIRQKDEAEKAGLIIVDPPAKGGKKNKKDDDFKKSPPKKQGRIAAKLAELMAQAEQIRREAERRKG